ncbi:MAG: YidH family protein [Sphingobacterium sp.]
MTESTHRNKRIRQGIEGKTNDHLANDRTFLAWIRTSLGIIGLGFIVVKFSMFLKQVSLMVGMTGGETHHDSFSSIIGVFLVAFGALTTLVSYLDYRRIRNQIDHNKFARRGQLINFMAVGIMLISSLLIWYLIEHNT